MLGDAKVCTMRKFKEARSLFHGVVFWNSQVYGASSIGGRVLDKTSRIMIIGLRSSYCW